MTVKKVLKASTGKYTDKTGKERNRYRIIGHLHDGQYGDYITLDRTVNLAGFPAKGVDDRVMVNLFDPEEKGEYGAKKKEMAEGSEPFNDPLPF